MVVYCHLTLNSDKTKIVYCKNANRKMKYANISFDYLGYTFRPRKAMNTKNKTLFTNFSPAISKKSRQKIHEIVKSWKLSSKLTMSLKEIASYVNPIIRGWVAYYSKFNKTEFRKVTQYLNESLARWMRRKFKSLNRYFGTAIRALAKTSKKQPNLFAHWGYGYRPSLKYVN